MFFWGFNHPCGDAGFRNHQHFDGFTGDPQAPAANKNHAPERGGAAAYWHFKGLGTVTIFPITPTAQMIAHAKRKVVFQTPYVAGSMYVRGVGGEYRKFDIDSLEGPPWNRQTNIWIDLYYILAFWKCGGLLRYTPKSCFYFFIFCCKFINHPFWGFPNSPFMETLMIFRGFFP